jgi:uncharacterized hydrophobic protein (TIGR00271 family)
MLQLRVFGPSATMETIAERLREMPGSRHVIELGNGDRTEMVVTADLVDDAIDGALKQVNRLGVPAEDVQLVHLESIGVAAGERPLASVVWSDLTTQANVNARPLPRYLVFMACAGVIAAFGVIYANVALVIGAMAISPDTLPITAAATAFVLARWRLAGRALLALGCGLGLAGLTGGLLTFVLHRAGLLPHVHFAQRHFLAGLTTVNVSTPLVALAAGVAGMLALQTRASSAVGVAISVTTIPASAALGVAAGLGHISDAGSAALVLAINVAMLLVGGSVTLIIQRRLAVPDRMSPNRDEAHG